MLHFFSNELLIHYHSVAIKDESEVKNVMFI